MTKKQLLRSVAFLLVVASMLYMLCDLFEYQNTYISENFKTFRNLEKNTVDGVVIGTSGIDRYWNSAKAYDEYGLTMYPLASDGMPSWLIISLLKEAERNQDLKLAVIDMRPFLLTYKGQTTRYDAYSRKVIDALGFFSASRFDAINRTQKVIYSEVEGSSRYDMSFMLSFIKYHSKWEEESFSFDELKDPETEYLGFLMHQKASLAKMKTEKEIYTTDERMDLYPLCEQILYEVLDYVKDKDYEVLFLNTPHYLDKTEAARLNTMCDILDKEGYAYANYEFDTEVYSFTEDFYNDGHTNFYGAEKFTEIFGRYLTENYDFEDRRNDERCAEEWDGVYDKMKETIALWEKKAAKK
ncbi:MAG: hypothetical protein IKJ27_06305 [Clostridia bacterium]|nr:hypothetical protein [Clostridia bacterium]